MVLPLVFQPLYKETHSTPHSMNRFVFPHRQLIKRRRRFPLTFAVV